MSVRIHIDRLVLHGVDAKHVDRDRIAEAVREELKTRFEEDGIPAGVVAPSMRPHESSVHAGAPRTSGPNGVGEFVGAALYGGLNK